MVSPGVVLSILPSAASWQESLYGVDIWSLRKPELSWMSIAHIWLVVSTISLSFIIDIEITTHLSMTLHRVKCSCKTSRKPSSVKVFVSSFYHKVGDFLSPYSALRRRRTLFGCPKVGWEFHKDCLIKVAIHKRIHGVSLLVSWLSFILIANLLK